jgi:hypothetical protein
MIVLDSSDRYEWREHLATGRDLAATIAVLVLSAGIAALLF